MNGQQKKNAELQRGSEPCNLSTETIRTYF